MRAPFLLLAAMAGCSDLETGDSAVFEQMAAQNPSVELPAELPPPISLSLSLPSILQQGADHILYVYGGYTGERAWILSSLNGEGVGGCHPMIGGECLGIQNPILPIGSGLVSLWGEARIGYRPRHAPGSQVCVQGVILRGPGGESTAFSDVSCMGVCDAGDWDDDGDGICNNYDTCRFDYENDVDGDGICGDVDFCPNDPANDADGDGLCAEYDPCPSDAQNDNDGDGLCYSVDPCPNDSQNDADGDGLCADADPCPADPDPACAPAAGCTHRSVAFSSTGSTGQWCNSDALLYYRDYGNLTFAECDCIANETGTQPYVGAWTAFGETSGWLGDLAGGNAAISDGSNWPHEAVVSETSSYRCALAQVTERRAPTVSPVENVYVDGLGRTWHYWQLNSQTVSQAMAFANARGARIISPDSVGRVGEGGFGTPPTHWCHANAMFNDSGNCNSDSICNFLVGYHEGGGGGGGGGGDLPAQCTSYRELSDSWRNIGQPADYAGRCDSSGNGHGFVSGWTRFSGAAGNQMATFPPGEGRCGTHASAWLNGSLPGSTGATNFGVQVCYQWGGSTCMWSQVADVTNCGSYYVYNLPFVNWGCSGAFCGM